MQLRRIILFISALILCVGLTACAQKEPKKVVVKPLTKEQVMEKISKKLQKQTKISPVEYENEETLINGWEKNKLIYIADNQYYLQATDDLGRDEQIYQLPGKQYTRNIYTSGETEKWEISLYETSLQDHKIKYTTPSGTMDELKAQTYFSALSTEAQNVHMKETASAYELELTSTDAAAIRKWMAPYLQKFADDIDPTRISFTKHNIKLTVNKKTFAVSTITDEVLFTRKTTNLDTGTQGSKDLAIKSKLNFTNAKKVEVPQKVLDEVKNDPMNIMIEQQQQYQEQFQQQQQ